MPRRKSTFSCDIARAVSRSEAGTPGATGRRRAALVVPLRPTLARRFRSRRCASRCRPKRALLPQPHGFEGFLPRFEAESDSDDLSVAELEDVELPHVDGDATHLAMSVPASGTDHGIAGVDDLFEVGAQLV